MIALASLRAHATESEERRFGRGRLAPTADALWQAADGYLDLLAAPRAGS